MLSNIPKRSWRNLVILAGALAAVVGLMVVPSHMAIGKTKATRKKIEIQVNEQRQLTPVFVRLVNMRNKLTTANADMPVRAAFARGTAGSVSDELTGLAASTGMQMVGVTSDLNALVNEAKMMQVDIVLRGELENYRLFLKQLIAMPHLEFIERLRITAIPKGREYGMRIWIALK